MVSPKILIVEDEMVVARDVQVQLQDMGYQVVGHATRGEDAIALTGQLRPHMVLMDIQLAGAMDGVSAAQSIRDQFGVPVIFLTAFTADDILARAKMAEPYGYILKPFSERELKNCDGNGAVQAPNRTSTARGCTAQPDHSGQHA